MAALSVSVRSFHNISFSANICETNIPFSLETQTINKTARSLIPSIFLPNYEISTSLRNLVTFRNRFVRVAFLHPSLPLNRTSKYATCVKMVHEFTPIWDITHLSSKYFKTTIVFIELKSRNYQYLFILTNTKYSLFVTEWNQKPTNERCNW
jgi:hypothetical protein